jgi:DNA processing protein
MDGETRFWVAFSVFPGIGPVRFKLLLDYFGSATEAWNASVSTLKKIKLGEKLSEEFAHFRQTFDLDAYLTQLEKKHISVLTRTNPRYPALLKTISDAPFLLYIKGKKNDPPIDLDRTIGVVGTRKITPYGKEVTERLVRGLVSKGFTIVSGLAYGGMQSPIRRLLTQEGNHRSIRCGIDIIAPPSNAKLYNDIANGYRKRDAARAPANEGIVYGEK